MSKYFIFILMVICLTQITRNVINFWDKVNFSNYKKYFNTITDFENNNNQNKIDIKEFLENKKNNSYKFYIKENINNDLKKISIFQNASFIIDIFLAILLIILPLVNYYNIGKNIEKIIKIICYIIGFFAFFLTFYNIYIIYIITDKYIIIKENKNISSSVSSYNNYQKKFNSDEINTQIKIDIDKNKDINLSDNKNNNNYLNENKDIAKKKNNDNKNENSKKSYFSYTVIFNIYLVIVNIIVIIFGYFLHKKIK